MIKKNKAGFTLAEVLLTMTIVGVVAAMTIPTLHYSRVKKEYTAKLKNFYSKMNNAVLDMELDKGSFRYMVLPAQGKGYDWYMENVDPYMGHQFIRNSQVYFKDGSKLMTFWSGAEGGTCLDVDYDINGDKGPNRQGYDRQRFLYCFSEANRRGHFGNDQIFFGTYGSGQTAAGTTRAQMITKCKSDPEWCTKILQNDQWEFKDDYPFKF